LANCTSDYRADVLQNLSNDIQNAKSVAVIGGGLVGVEIASEIICKYPQKEVIIVHAHQELVPRLPEKAQAFAEKFLKDRKVQIFKGERVTSFSGLALSYI
jgi:NADH dehydrogenase FAD-containing subunit